MSGCSHADTRYMGDNWYQCDACGAGFDCDGSRIPGTGEQGPSEEEYYRHAYDDHYAGLANENERAKPEEVKP